MDALLLRQRQNDAMGLLAIDPGAVVSIYEERRAQALDTATRVMLTTSVHIALGDIAKNLATDACSDCLYAIPTIGVLETELSCALGEILIAAEFDDVISKTFGCDYDTAMEAERAIRQTYEQAYEPMIKDLARDLHTAVLDAWTDEPGGTD